MRATYVGEPTTAYSKHCTLDLVPDTVADIKIDGLFDHCQRLIDSA